jgi:hypothetical protein
MLDQTTQSPSPNNPVSRSNGLADPNQPTYNQRKYVLEDFSQQAINRGQQEINYLIVVVDEKIVDALKQVSNAVAKLASCGEVDLKALDNAINQVSEATKNVAGPFPPGCGDDSQSQRLS